MAWLTFSWNPDPVVSEVLRIHPPGQKQQQQLWKRTASDQRPASAESEGRAELRTCSLENFRTANGALIRQALLEKKEKKKKVPVFTIRCVFACPKFALFNRVMSNLNSPQVNRCLYLCDHRHPGN